ncbi:MAG: rhodanese-like domain-containing protein [Candidatus Hodarchaeales archaeon]
MENEGTKIKEMKIGKLRMGLKFIRLFLYRIVKRGWFLPSTSEMTVDELFAKINDNLAPLVIDLRGEDEFNGGGENSYMTVFGHIAKSKRMGITELSANLEDLSSFKDKEIVTICPGGGMSLIAVDIMTEAGFTDVKSLKGGIVAWEKKGYPLVNTQSATTS